MGPEVDSTVPSSVPDDTRLARGSFAALPRRLCRLWTVRAKKVPSVSGNVEEDRNTSILLCAGFGHQFNSAGKYPTILGLKVIDPQGESDAARDLVLWIGVRVASGTSTKRSSPRAAAVSAHIAVLRCLAESPLPRC